MLQEFLERPDDEKWLGVLLVAFAVGFLMALLMRTESLKRKPIHGGAGAQVFHFLANITICTLIPWAILGLIAGLHISWLFPIGILFPISTFTLLIGYGYFENQADYVEVQPIRELD